MASVRLSFYPPLGWVGAGWGREGRWRSQAKAREWWVTWGLEGAGSHRSRRSLLGARSLLLARKLARSPISRFLTPASRPPGKAPLIEVA